MEEHLNETLLSELREEPLPWVAIGLMLAGQLLIIVGSQTNDSFAIVLGLFAVLLFVLIWWLRGKSGAGAAWLLNLTTLVFLVLTWVHFPQAHVPYLFSLVVIEAAILLQLGAVILFAALGVAATVAGYFWLPMVPTEGSDLILQLILIVVTTILMVMEQYPRKTMVHWAWKGYQDARQHLEEARNRQLELKEALADLALANKETMRLNTLLTAARQAVDEARRAKEEFVANVSHELRTPLDMIIGFSDMILESPEIYAVGLPPALMADVAAIKRNSEHLAGLVDDVLALAELDAGRTQLNQEITSLQELTSDAVRIVKPFYDQKALSLTTDVPPDLPPVYCDRLRIRQVLLNLLTNAARFTAQGGVSIQASQGAAVIEIRITDTGPGIAREALSGLFEPFRQADASIRRRYGGTGLGLAISKRFVEMHGGQIWIESEPGRGTTVVFTLPIEPPIAANEPRRWFSPYQEYTPRTRPSTAPVSGDKPCVVIVEKGETLSRLVTRYVDDLEPLAVPNLEEAKTAVEVHSAAALVIDDTALPACEQPQLPPLAFDIPVIRCQVPQAESYWKTLHIRGYLVKPIQREELLKSIRALGADIRTILLADDDPEARQLFGRMLTAPDNGYRVLYAMDGVTTLEMLKERKPDLLLLDLVMPNKDGFAVLDAMSEDQTIGQIPVIIISALDVEQDPIISQEMVVSRQEGLTARELILSLRAVTQVLRPRFGAPKPPAGPYASLASGRSRSHPGTGPDPSEATPYTQ